MDNETGLFEKAPGDLSSMRVAFISLACVFGGVLAACCVISTLRAGDIGQNVVYACLGALAIAFGGKSVQSFAERK